MTDVSNPSPGVALVTGGARRVGKALVQHLIAKKWRVAIHYHTSEQEVNELHQTIIDQGGICHLFQANLANEEDAHSLIPNIMDTFGGLNLLINNASTFAPDDPLTGTRDSWDFHLEANLRAPCILMQTYATLVREQKELQRKALIINMIDQRVWHLKPNFMSYTVSKYGLWGLTQTMALSLAPDIRVNAIGPGPILPDQYHPEKFEDTCAHLPLKMGGKIEDICAAVDFFWASQSVTGQMIAVGGGGHL